MQGRGRGLPPPRGLPNVLYVQGRRVPGPRVPERHALRQRHEDMLQREPRQLWGQIQTPE